MDMLRFAVALVFCVGDTATFKGCTDKGTYRKRPSLYGIASRSSFLDANPRWQAPLAFWCMSKCNEENECKAFNVFSNNTCELLLSRVQRFTIDETASLYSAGEFRCPSGFNHTFRIEPLIDTGHALHSCYKLVTEELFWEEARDNCHDQGGDLVSIESREEQTHLQGVINKYPNAAIEGYWTSGSDAEKGQWKWMATSALLTYGNWAHWEPDNRDGSGEPYLVISKKKIGPGPTFRPGSRFPLYNRREATKECITVVQFRSDEGMNQLLCSILVEITSYKTASIRQLMQTGQVLHSCYKLAAKEMSWEAARVNCHEEGGDLVSIESQVEQTHLQDVINKCPNAAISDTEYWTSGSDAENEGQWKWMAIVELLNYSKWITGEPGGGSGEPYLLLSKDHNWASGDIPASYKFSSICVAHAIF